MAKNKMPKKEQDIKSNVYLIECRRQDCKRQGKSHRFEKRIFSDRWLRKIKGCIYEIYHNFKLKKYSRIGFVECDRCHSSCNLRIVKRLYEE